MNLGEIIEMLRRFQALEEAAQITAMRHAHFHTPEMKKEQKKWIEERIKRFNTKGTRSGRFQSGKPNLSNIPKPADEYPRTSERKGDYIYHTQGGYTWVEPVKKEEEEGELKGKEITCPPERLRPVRAKKIVDPEPEPTPEKPPIVIYDFGYGPACSRCHATKGECHGKNCPHAGDTV